MTPEQHIARIRRYDPHSDPMPWGSIEALCDAYEKLTQQNRLLEEELRNFRLRRRINEGMFGPR